MMEAPDSYYQSFETERLLMRPLESNDIRAWERFYIKNSSLKYLGIDLNRDIPRMAKAWISDQLTRYAGRDFGQLAVVHKATGALIGTRGFRRFEYEQATHLMSMGSFIPKYWRQGYGSESARCLIKWVKEWNPNCQIYSSCHIDNLASQVYLEKLGFLQINRIAETNRSIFLYQYIKEPFEFES